MQIVMLLILFTDTSEQPIMSVHPPITAYLPGKQREHKLSEEHI